MKNKRLLAMLVCAGLAFNATILGSPVTGAVRLVSGDIATVTIDGDVMPPTGARGEFFFKMTGGGEEISVASAIALGIDHGNLLVKIENATGKVEAGQLVRFSSSPPPSPAASPSTRAATGLSIIGDWVGSRAEGTVLSFSLKEDKTFLLIAESEFRSVTLRGKYRVDTTAQPHRIELFEIDPATERGNAISGIFEFQADARVTIDLSDGYQNNPGHGFTDGAIVFSKATLPIVAPSEKVSPSP